MQFDEIGNWSEIKLEIIEKYATSYSTILSRQKGLHHLYIDAFAGSGIHVSRTTGEFIPGSPLNALNVTPPFREYYLIDLKRDKVAALQELVGDRPDVHILQGDSNVLLLDEIFPKVAYRDFKRALCLLDPYGLHLNWQVIERAGSMKTVEMFLNFPVADMNRNVLWRRDVDNVDPADIERVNAFWGDDSWTQVVYSTTGNLFGWREKIGDNDTVAQAFRDRLKTKAGFTHVPDPLPMRNSRGAIVYYLFFAAQQPVADKIVKAIFSRYRGAEEDYRG
jgi:three-Cys-motif partner protein